MLWGMLGTGVDITLVSTDVEGSTELWEWVSGLVPDLPVGASSYPHAHLYVCLLAHVVCPLAHVGLPLCLTDCLLPPICLSVCLSVPCLSVCLSVPCLSVCLPACLSVPTLTLYVPADLLVGLSATLLVKLSLI